MHRVLIAAAISVTSANLASAQIEFAPPQLIGGVGVGDASIISVRTALSSPTGATVVIEDDTIQSDVNFRRFVGGDLANQTHAGLLFPFSAPGTSLATDGLGNWMAVSSTPDLIVGGVGKGTDWDVVFSRSTDDGITWTTPSLCFLYAVPDSRTDHVTRVVYHPSHGFVMVWHSDHNLGTGQVGNDYDVLWSRFVDPSFGWSFPQVLVSGQNTDTREDAATDLFVSPAGVVISFATFGGVPVGNAAVLSPSNEWETVASMPPATTINPIVRPLPNGTWLAVWMDNPKGHYDLFFSISTDNCSSWSTPDRINPASASESNSTQTGSLAVLPDRAVVVWNKRTDAGVNAVTMFSELVYGATDWAPAEELVTGSTLLAGLDGDAQVAYSPTLPLLVVWSSTKALVPGAGGDADNYFVSGTIITRVQDWTTQP